MRSRQLRQCRGRRGDALRLPCPNSQTVGSVPRRRRIQRRGCVRVCRKAPAAANAAGNRCNGHVFVRATRRSAHPSPRAAPWAPTGSVVPSAPPPGPRRRPPRCAACCPGIAGVLHTDRGKWRPPASTASAGRDCGHGDFNERMPAHVLDRRNRVVQRGAHRSSDSSTLDAAATALPSSHRGRRGRLRTRTTVRSRHRRQRRTRRRWSPSARVRPASRQARGPDGERQAGGGSRHVSGADATRHRAALSPAASHARTGAKLRRCGLARRHARAAPARCSGVA